jgi:predicted acyl esterase
VVPTTHADPPVAPALDRFFRYDRPAQFGNVRLDVRVPMRDGAHLGCYLYVPAVQGTSTPAPGRFPGIVDNFTPYYIAYPVGAFSGAYFAEHGYLDLECTPRGTGTSEGTFPGWFAEIEARDNYDLIEWLARRPDSTGRVGQEGNSYGGMTAYRVAALHPPSLVAIAPQQAYSSMYLNYTYPGGIRSLGDPYWSAFAGAVGFARPAASTQEAAWLAHPRLDDYWRQIDIDTKWSEIDVPVLGFGGWVDIFQDGMVRNHLGLRGPSTYLVDGPWHHGNTFDATVTHGTLLAWFDRWLYGDTGAPLPPTHVSSYRMPDGPWQSLRDWPPRGVHAQASALTTADGLSATAGPAGTRAYDVNPGAGVADRSSGDHLEFTGPAVVADTTIAGAGEVHLVATLDDPSGATAGAPDAVDTNFVFHLYDVGAAGDKTLVTRGYLKATHRTSHTTPERIPLATPVEYTIPLWHVHHRVAAGHHLVLRLQTGEEDCCLSAAPAAAQPVPPLRVTVATGEGGSRLVLPVLPP